MNDFAPKLTRHHGFTLIELMVVVAIIAILASVALPAYKNMVLRSHRSEAHGLIQAAQLGQEKFRLNNTTYAADFSDAAFARVCNNNVTSPCEGANQYYTLTVSGADASSYVLTATAQGTQADDTDCATITLTQTATDITYGPSTACWGR